MFSTKEIFHKLDFSKQVNRPKQFTFPFSYVAHTWVKQASEDLQVYLENQTDFDYKFGWNDESVGKMFGVLIVENQNGELGYLSAFSGRINDTMHLNGFVPPVFDILNPNGFFKKGEAELNQINQKVTELENSEEYKDLVGKLKSEKLNYENGLKALKEKHKTAKKKRQEQRKALGESLNSEQKELLIELENESKLHHFELKDFKRLGKEKINLLEQNLIELKEEINQLKTERKEKSAELQAQIHQNFSFLNALGENKNLLDVFTPYDVIPPAGAGECAAPKLLQYAYANGFKPIAMGEFWWGKSPSGIIRKEKQFYPACKSKCKPILEFMLQGLDVEDNPITKNINDFELETIYEDDYLLVVNKPAGVLSVPGKKIKESLQTKIQQKYPDKEITLVHRLDMATSGLVLVAKSLYVYKKLQEQFTNRTVKKTYTAILDGVPEQDSGKIELPLRVDLDNRPMQMVCYKYGKNAITYYKVIDKKDGKSRVLFYPYTGRTHQLRVHSAHKDGLNVAMVGDVLYGTPKDRLYLHATELIFEHPISGEEIKVSCRVPF